MKPLLTLASGISYDEEAEGWVTVVTWVEGLSRGVDILSPALWCD